MKLLLIGWALSLSLYLTEAAAQSSQATAFFSVNVVPMDRERVLWNHTVLVEGGVITAVGPAQTLEVPRDAQRIEGRGTAFLLPGLSDMHSHVFSKHDFPLYTVNGITTVLQLGGALEDFIADAKRSIEEGSVVGPRIFFSLLVDGDGDLPEKHSLVKTPDDARRALARARDGGYDFIKVYNQLSAENFAILVEGARDIGIAVIGHGVRDVGLPEALFEGQVMVAHAEEFFYTAFGNEPNYNLMSSVVSRTFESGAYVVPDLSAFEVIARQWGKPRVVDEFLADPRARLMTADTRARWPQMPYKDRDGDIELMLVFLRDLTLALQEAGVPLMTGTDNPDIPGMFPGYSIHEDLRTLIEAGLTEYQALSAATRIPGEFIAAHGPASDPFGVVEIGMAADLVLVTVNPLVDIETLRSPLGVMTDGRWFSSSDLQSLLVSEE